MAIGAQYQLNEDQIANSLFDMIHIAGTAGTSALLGSVIGILCLKNALRDEVISEINAVWDGKDTPNRYALEQSTLIDKVILETARLYPPVRFVSQLTTEPGEVEIGSKQCPFQRGTRLLGSLSWNGEGHERACPGRSLSIGLIKMFCFYLVKNYQWNSFTEVKWDFENVTAVTPNDLVLQGFTQQF